MRPDRSGSANKRVASKITPRLYLTCLATAKDVTQLAELGITHVVSAIEKAPTFPSTYPLRTLHVSVSDYDGEDILSHLPATTSFIRGALAESPENRVLVRTLWLLDGPCATTPRLINSPK
jgi:atypical dual specificity phosphatase